MDKRLAKEALKKANDALASLGVRYWIDCGTLLSAVRHSDFMDHDLDVDFSSFDWWRHEEIANAMKSAGFRLTKSYGFPEHGFEQAFRCNGVKVDIFYFYPGTAKGPEEGTCWQGSWDMKRPEGAQLIESRFPTDIVRTTTPLSFKGIKVPVPVEFEAMLTARYNDWTVVRPKWNWRTDPACIVGPLDDTTFLIKTFMRPDVALRAVRSIRAAYGGVPILVVDDSDVPADFEEDFRSHGVKLLRLPYDSGLSAGRNAGIKEITTRFACLMDDDHLITVETDVPAMLRLLEGERADVVCGTQRQKGQISRWEGHFERTRDAGLVLRQYEGTYRHSQGLRWARVDFGINCFVARTDFLREHPWDEDLKVHEHIDWALGLGDARLLFTPDSVFEHERDQPPGYRKMRYRPEFRLRWFGKHGFSYRTGTSGHRDVWTSDDDAALRLLEGETKQRWEREHQSYERDWHNTSPTNFRKDDVAWLAYWDEVFEWAKPESPALDVGCGSRPPLVGRVDDSYGIEPLAGEFIAPAKWTAGMEIRKCPAEEFVEDFEGRFNFVLCWNVLDHTFDPRAVLRNIARYLAPGGVLYLATDTRPPALGHPGVGDKKDFERFLHSTFSVEEIHRDRFERDLVVKAKSGRTSRARSTALGNRAGLDPRLAQAREDTIRREKEEAPC